MTQKEMVETFGPILKTSQLYANTGDVWIRDAVPGEKVATDGGVTTAKEGDKVVKNIEASGEEYIISVDRVHSRYNQFRGEAPSPWKTYRAKGFIKAFKINPEDFGVQDTFSVEAPWGKSMECTKGDYIATDWVVENPYHNTKEQNEVTEVYRIAAKEFKRAYE